MSETSEAPKSPRFAARDTADGDAPGFFAETEPRELRISIVDLTPLAVDDPLTAEDLGARPLAAEPRPRKRRILAPFLVLVAFAVLTPPACYLEGLFHLILTGALRRAAYDPSMIIVALGLGAGFLALGLYWALACGLVEALYRSRRPPPEGPPCLPERQRAIFAVVLVVLIFASPAVAYGASGALYMGLGLWGEIADGTTSIFAVSTFTLIGSFVFGVYWYAAVRLFAYARHG